MPMVLILVKPPSSKLNNMKGLVLVICQFVSQKRNIVLAVTPARREPRQASESLSVKYVVVLEVCVH